MHQGAALLDRAARHASRRQAFPDQTSELLIVPGCDTRRDIRRALAASSVRAVAESASILERHPSRVAILARHGQHPAKQ